MAGRKATKSAEEVMNKSLMQNTENEIGNEQTVTEERLENTPSDTLIDANPNTDETEKIESEPMTGELSSAGEDLIDGDVKELIDEVGKVGDTLNSEELKGENATELISHELEHAKELEEKLKEKVNESEKDIKAVRNEQFCNFWCGVSDGWNN